MPLLEILGPAVQDETRQRIAAAATEAVCAAFAVLPQTVTVYFLDRVGHACAHAGQAGASAAPRIFVKLHAYRRDVSAKRRAASALAAALGVLYGQPLETIVIYFFERAPDEVSHGGILAADA